MNTQIASFSRINVRLTYSLTAFAVATLLWSCGQDSASTPTPAQNTTMAAQYQQMRASFNSLEGDWLLTTYQNDPLPAALQNKAWLRFTKESGDTHRIGGVSFINYYGGTARLDETKGVIVVTSDLLQTLMGSTDDAVNKAEARYLSVLRKATSYELATNGQLRITLSDQHGTVTDVMVFSKTIHPCLPSKMSCNGPGEQDQPTHSTHDGGVRGGRSG